MAGLGSAALFRTALFTVRMGEQDIGIGIGPSALLTAILKSVDSPIDRGRALKRLDENVMKGISFAKHYSVSGK
ncbi:hypothetical protein [Vitiosangium sp. GDMCC 1.1324]|uniref:hypothetical protein n=1 Tax=Vitiosangium sp. (strain GDMCC 1.1324) TaxID=2138576 RepID=UPI0018EEC4A4|nr:hypothetical protein [Vitiosangium sp. GDMCC 1.1324]